MQNCQRNLTKRFYGYDEEEGWNGGNSFHMTIIINVLHVRDDVENVYKHLYEI